MAIRYVDTSAAMKLLVNEQYSVDLIEYLKSDTTGLLVSSWLLHTELYCAADRHPDSLIEANIAKVLERILLIDLVRSDLVFAGGLEKLRANDAIHLAVAIRVGAKELIAYDAELLDAAHRRGISKVSPGALLAR